MESAASVVTGLCRFNNLTRKAKIIYSKKEDHAVWKNILKKLARFKTAKLQVSSTLSASSNSVIQRIGAKSVRLSNNFTHIDP